MAEMIDIYDANLTRIGEMERLEAHLKGQWHATFHLWIVLSTSPGFVLYQLRSPSAKNFPNMLDVSAAGHLLAGEKVEAGLREAKEELGIDLPFTAIQSLGWRVEVADQENGQHNREHQAVHIVRLDADLSSFAPDPTEVYGVIKVPIGEGLKMHCGALKQLSCEARIYDPSSAAWKNAIEVLTPPRFLPRIQPYYRTIHIMAERLLHGGLALSI